MAHASNQGVEYSLKGPAQSREHSGTQRLRSEKPYVRRAPQFNDTKVLAMLGGIVLKYGGFGVF